YTLDGDLQPLAREFLGDPQAVKDAAEAVAKQA
ncbi:MAG: 2,3-diphosphoglycerate-dependent phosphoglycerate mutase, partial [Gammaproteobacteria bacterium]|nr:2,3-diphosphoglycerate-dependent phosphoglycerate mutase [Gammaproteobacteria bacterium]